MTEKIDHREKESVSKLRAEFDALKHQIALQGTENDLPYDKKLYTTMEETIKSIELSSDLQFLIGYDSFNDKIKPKLGYDISFGPISIPKNTGYHVYHKQAGIKMDDRSAELYVDYAKTEFEPQFFEGDTLTNDLKRRISGFADKTSVGLDSESIKTVRSDVVIRSIYGSNQTNLKLKNGKVFTSRPQSLEEFLVKYTVTTTDGKEVVFTTRNYFTHEPPTPWNKDIYSKKVGPVGTEISDLMSDYWVQLIDLIKTQANINVNQKKLAQENVLKDFFKSIIHLNEKQDVTNLQQRIATVKNSIAVDKTSISLQDPWRNQLVKEISGCDDGRLPKDMFLSFVYNLMSRYNVTSSKIASFQSSTEPKGEKIDGSQFVEQRQGMGEFPDEDFKFTMLTIREQNPITIYQSESGRLYYGGLGGVDKVNNPTTGKIEIQRKSIELTDTSIAQIITEVYSQYVCARTGEERSHYNDIINLAKRNGIILNSTIGDPSAYFEKITNSTQFSKQFVNSYDTEQNNKITGEKGYIARYKEKNGSYKLGFNITGTYISISKVTGGFKVEENGRSYILDNRSDDQQTIAGFLQLIQKKMDEFTEEYGSKVIDRKVTH